MKKFAAHLLHHDWHPSLHHFWRKGWTEGLKCKWCARARIRAFGSDWAANYPDEPWEVN